jgi:hypothetical protein
VRQDAPSRRTLCLTVYAGKATLTLTRVAGVRGLTASAVLTRRRRAHRLVFTVGDEPVHVCAWCGCDQVIVLGVHQIVG